MLGFLRESEICYRISEFYSTSAQTVQLNMAELTKHFKQSRFTEYMKKCLIKRDTSCDIIIKI